MMILEMFSLLHAWLIPHLMAKSSTSVLVTKAVWWTVLIKGWLCMWMCETDVAMLFLILASVTTIAMWDEDDEWSIILSSCWKCDLLLFTLLLWIKTQRVKSRNNSCIGVTQENSIEFLIQSSLPYILLPMVRASYGAPYPKWPWV